ncbi:hypothetical protein AYO21_00293 [Fonsecaea monophora]|uniref:Uncharacterized protein n=1 Tax=Fonsecaea monophora TaxID=254056 RepID=A0A177FN62_9EURO|nr:hypothetical protein AYO21_00293 [Fonsecaea monophora]KAH0832808.1 hypothetical protein FOPE_01430 [Fonsecaea pedrosoi]OAG45657.1 hypothetical protein AYO21_00293 [Fonsecaea monophora]
MNNPPPPPHQPPQQPPQMNIPPQPNLGSLGGFCVPAVLSVILNTNLTFALQHALQHGYPLSQLRLVTYQLVSQLGLIYNPSFQLHSLVPQQMWQPNAQMTHQDFENAGQTTAQLAGLINQFNIPGTTGVGAIILLPPAQGPNGRASMHAVVVAPGQTLRFFDYANPAQPRELTVAWNAPNSTVRFLAMFWYADINQRQHMTPPPSKTGPSAPGGSSSHPAGGSSTHPMMAPTSGAR